MCFEALSSYDTIRGIGKASVFKERKEWLWGYAAFMRESEKIRPAEIFAKQENLLGHVQFFAQQILCL